MVWCGETIIPLISFRVYLLLKRMRNTQNKARASHFISKYLVLENLILHMLYANNFRVTITTLTTMAVSTVATTTSTAVDIFIRSWIPKLTSNSNLSLSLSKTHHVYWDACTQFLLHVRDDLHGGMWRFFCIQYMNVCVFICLSWAGVQRSKIVYESFVCSFWFLLSHPKQNTK